MNKKFVVIYSSCLLGLFAILFLLLEVKNNSDSANLALNAKQTQACEENHNMKTQESTVRGDLSYLDSLYNAGENLGNAIQNYNNSNAPNLITYEFCDWPPNAYSDSDGFSQIQMYTRPGPGVGEASDANVADVFDPQCSSFIVSYQIATQGWTNGLSNIIIQANEITSEDRTVLNQAQLNFYPGIGEAVFLHNDKASLQTIRCDSSASRNTPHSTFSISQ